MQKVYWIGMIALFSGVTNMVLLWQSTPESGPVTGYLGFADGKPWQLQFNDCTVSALEQARPYLWFDRQLKQVSCYQFQASDAPLWQDQAIKVYAAPDFNADFVKVMRLSEFKQTESGWGVFPKVYQKAPESWYQLQEGWLHLSANDQAVVTFFAGEQDAALQQAHDDYYDKH
jgi:hypothetical protein